jgi:hypothetical protein
MDGSDGNPSRAQLPVPENSLNYMLDGYLPTTDIGGF